MIENLRNNTFNLGLLSTNSEQVLAAHEQVNKAIRSHKPTLTGAIQYLPVVQNAVGVARFFFGLMEMGYGAVNLCRKDREEDSPGGRSTAAKVQLYHGWMNSWRGIDEALCDPIMGLALFLIDTYRGKNIIADDIGSVRDGLRNLSLVEVEYA
ncbi:MAG: hypothetical protein K940chlam8_01172 [Chlamydiae bacterium]|nr:hypothetical protein [Chlamydiota bacterium]